jgi:MFS family permease
VRLGDERPATLRKAFTTTAFGRLTAVQILSLGGDAMVTVSLLGSLFFSISPSAARSKLALGLLFTVAPFAIVQPFLGPAVERIRGGPRVMIVVSALARAVAAVLMAFWIHSLALFLAALLSLVFSKVYIVSKASLVPLTVTRPEQLVEANSKLSISGIAGGALAGSIGASIDKLFSSATLLRFDAVVFVFCALMALRMRPALLNRPPGFSGTTSTRARRSPRRPAPADPPETSLRSLGANDGFGSDATAVLPAGELPAIWPGDTLWPPDPTFGRGLADAVAAAESASEPAAESAPIGAQGRRGAPPPPPGSLQLAAVVMGTLRASVGFMTFLVAFAFRDAGAPAIWYGLVLAAGYAGNVGGAALAPILRVRFHEERIVISAIIAVAITAPAVMELSVLHRWLAALILALVVGLGAGGGKLAFDSLVQRDVPSNQQSRVFVRLEAGFQTVWVVGALLPVVVAVSLEVGFLIVAVVSAAALVSYLWGTQLAKQSRLPRWFPQGRGGRSGGRARARLAARRRRGTAQDPRPGGGHPAT